MTKKYSLAFAFSSHQISTNVFLNYFLVNLLISHNIIATTITIPRTPTHIPALKIEPIAAQLLMEKAIRKNSLKKTN